MMAMCIHLVSLEARQLYYSMVSSQRQWGK